MEEKSETLDNEEVKVTNVLNRRLVPETVAILDCSEEHVLARIKSLPEAKSRALE